MIAHQNPTLGASGSGSQLMRSCKKILDGGGLVGNRTYIIDPDGSGIISPFNVYCDMSGGGWTLIASSSSTSPGVDNIVAELLSTNSAGILSQQKIVALANISNSVRIDGSGNSVTSTTSQPIARLRQFKSMSTESALQGSANWTGNAGYLS